MSTLSAFSPWLKKNLKEKEHILPKCVEYIQNILGGMVKGLHIFWGIEKSSFLKKLGFTPFKAEQLLQGMELQEKEAQKG